MAESLKFLWIATDRRERHHFFTSQNAAQSFRRLNGGSVDRYRLTEKVRISDKRDPLPELVVEQRGGRGFVWK